MTEMEYLEVHNLEYQKVDEFLEDKDSKIFDIILLNDNIETSKNKLKILKDQGIDLHSIFKSHFCREKTLNFPNFIDWCVSNYSSYERVIMDSTKTKILCPVNALVFHDYLDVPPIFIEGCNDFNDEYLIRSFRHATIEEKQPFFSKCIP